MSEMKDHYDEVEWGRRDIEFHQIIARGTRNERVVRACGTIYDECFYLMKSFISEVRKLHEKKEHLTEVLADRRAHEDHAAVDRAEKERRLELRRIAGFEGSALSLLEPVEINRNHREKQHNVRCQRSDEQRHQ